MKNDTGGIRVLIVDDSALSRRMVREMLSGDAHIQDVETAVDPYMAVEKIRRQVPDVIVLDIEMPRMDGLQFLKRIMAQHPLPVVICSSLAAGKGDAVAEKALELGAVDIVPKPKVGGAAGVRHRMVDAVRCAAATDIRQLLARKNAAERMAATADLLLPAPCERVSVHTEPVVAVAASTGGIAAIRTLLESLPADGPAMLIVQHMPSRFTRQFAANLNDAVLPEVKEASDGDPVRRGRILFAPGNQHMVLERAGTSYSVSIREGGLVARHRPSADVLFRSVAGAAGPNSIGILLTGMGVDGATGLLEMRALGAHTIAQDEKTSVVYGMPGAAVKKGAVAESLPIGEIAAAFLKRSRNIAEGLR